MIFYRNNKGLERCIMDKKKLLIGLLILFLFTIVKVDALSCDYEERAKLNNEVKNIKVNYEVKEKELPKGVNVPDEYIGTDYVVKEEYFQINILNLTENEVVKVTNDKNKNVITIKYSDTTDGNYSFDWDDLSAITKLSFEVLTSNKTGCSDESIKTLTLQLPRYNSYSQSNVCETMPDYYLCQKYVTYDYVDYSSFSNSIAKEQTKRDEEKQKSNSGIWDFFKNNKNVIIIGGIVVVVLVGGTIVYIKIRRGRDDV